MIRLILHGARGRMGRRVCALARRDSRFETVAELARDDDHRTIDPARAACDVVVDFSSGDGARRAAVIARDHRAALLVATTGLSAEFLHDMDDLARSIPVMIAPNLSLGIAVFNHLALLAARLLGGEFDVDLIEAHHARKRDAPSGTALHLSQLLRDHAGVILPPDRMHSIRAGDIVGQHAVQFAGPGQILRISHVATDPGVFAHGALHAAAWLAGRPPGRYAVEQVLGLPTLR